MEKDLKKILLVDDEPDITFIVEFLLANANFKVTRLNDATLALGELKSGGYDLMILDLMMPKLSGFELLEIMKKDEAVKGQRVLILSSRQLSKEETTYLDSVGADVIAKPFEPHRLLEKVREMLAD